MGSRGYLNWFRGYLKIACTNVFSHSSLRTNLNGLEPEWQREAALFHTPRGEICFADVAIQRNFDVRTLLVQDIGLLGLESEKR